MCLCLVPVNSNLCTCLTPVRHVIHPFSAWSSSPPGSFHHPRHDVFDFSAIFHSAYRLVLITLYYLPLFIDFSRILSRILSFYNISATLRGRGLNPYPVFPLESKKNVHLLSDLKFWT